MYQGNATVLVYGREKHIRFKISETKGLLHIWLEDRESKAQWRVCAFVLFHTVIHIRPILVFRQTKQLALDDFVTNDNVLPQATMSDYAKEFAAILTSGGSLPKDVICTMSGEPNELGLCFALRALSFSVKPVYRFQLLPIPLEKVDVLAAQVEDLKEEVKNLQTKLEAIAKPMIHVDSNAADY